MFYRPKGLCKADTEGGLIVFTNMSYFLLGNVYWTFNLKTVFCLFGTIKMLYGLNGMDGMGQNIKSVLQISLYFVSI